MDHHLARRAMWSMIIVSLLTKRELCQTLLSLPLLQQTHWQREGSFLKELFHGQSLRSQCQTEERSVLFRNRPRCANKSPCAAFESQSILSLSPLPWQEGDATTERFIAEVKSLIDKSREQLKKAEFRRSRKRMGTADSAPETSSHQRTPAIGSYVALQ
mmetsp:Transcript_19165/g.39015  ORF Transcript_19165/g.39015 Transcript_19165/m.39015 type:complete len:159 (-) Transcript_19165:427-903(-)